MIGFIEVMENHMTVTAILILAVLILALYLIKRLKRLTGFGLKAEFGETGKTEETDNSATADEEPNNPKNAA